MKLNLKIALAGTPGTLIKLLMVTVAFFQILQIWKQFSGKLQCFYSLICTMTSSSFFTRLPQTKPQVCTGIITFWTTYTRNVDYKILIWMKLNLKIILQKCFYSHLHNDCFFLPTNKTWCSNSWTKMHRFEFCSPHFRTNIHSARSRYLYSTSQKKHLPPDLAADSRSRSRSH